MTVPQPRKPKCYVHHIWHASCPDCTEQRKAEREQAAKRLEQATR